MTTFRCNHPKTPENTSRTSDGYTTCRQCKNERQKAYKLKVDRGAKVRRRRFSPRVKQVRYEVEALLIAMGGR